MVQHKTPFLNIQETIQALASVHSMQALESLASRFPATVAPKPHQILCWIRANLLGKETECNKIYLLESSCTSIHSAIQTVCLKSPWPLPLLGLARWHRSVFDKRQRVAHCSPDEVALEKTPCIFVSL